MKYFSLFSESKKLYEKGLTQEEVGKYFGVSQKVIWGLFKRNGYKCRVARKRNQNKERNDSWRGDDACYAAMHIRVEKLRGKPKKCAMCDITKGRFEWASLTKNYKNPFDYVRLCSSCHKRLDRGGDAL